MFIINFPLFNFSRGIVWSQLPTFLRLNKILDPTYTKTNTKTTTISYAPGLTFLGLNKHLNPTYTNISTNTSTIALSPGLTFLRLN